MLIFETDLLSYGEVETTKSFAIADIKIYGLSSCEIDDCERCVKYENGGEKCISCEDTSGSCKNEA